jgi:hypothetical protein
MKLRPIAEPRRLWILVLTLCGAALVASAQAPLPSASTIASELVLKGPAGTRQLLNFGERPDWSPDGTRFVFLDQVFGNAWEYELSSGRLTPITLHFRHHGFTRAMYLKNGDILLSGPITTFDRSDPSSRQEARSNSYLSILRPHQNQPPTPLGVHCDEGPAVSKHRLRVAWTHGTQDRISVADITYTDDGPRLENVREVLNRSDFPPGQRPAKWIETQDFIPPADEKLTVTAYEIEGSAHTATYVFDLASRELTEMSRAPWAYTEAEGIFPDGLTTFVELAPHHGNPWPLVDIYRLELDGSGRMARVTYFTELDGWKANQPVVSPDGKTMLFCCGRRGTEAGEGFGIFLAPIPR